MAARRRNSRRPATRQHRWPTVPRWLRPAGWAVLAVGIVALTGGLVVRLVDQPIERLQISGTLQHVSALDVETVVRSQLHGAGLLTVNLERISQGLSTLPWVDSASLQRSWPRGLRIQIVEQTAVARWNQSGLLNARGELFVSAAHFLPPELPELEGPLGAEPEVTQRYLAMQARLTEMSLRLTTLSIDARGAWNFTLDDGVLVHLGRTQVDERFERFMLAAAKLVRSRSSDIADVDMRYGNGFAVGWKGTAGPAAPLANKGDQSHFNDQEKIG